VSIMRCLDEWSKPLELANEMSTLISDDSPGDDISASVAAAVGTRDVGASTGLSAEPPGASESKEFEVSVADAMVSAVASLVERPRLVCFYLWPSFVVLSLLFAWLFVGHCRCNHSCARESWWEFICLAIYVAFPHASICPLEPQANEADARACNRNVQRKAQKGRQVSPGARLRGQRAD